MKKLFAFLLKVVLFISIPFPWWEPPFYGSFLFLGEPEIPENLKDALKNNS